MSKITQKRLKSRVVALMKAYNDLAPEVKEYASEEIVTQYHRYTILDVVLITIVCPVVTVAVIAAMMMVPGATVTREAMAELMFIGVILNYLLSQLVTVNGDGEFLPPNDKFAIEVLRRELTQLRYIGETIVKERERLAVELAAFKELERFITKELHGSYQLFEKVTSNKGHCHFYVLVKFSDESEAKDYPVCLSGYERLEFEVAKRWVPQARQTELLNTFRAALVQRG